MSIINRDINPKVWYMGIAYKGNYATDNILTIYHREFKTYSDVIYFMKINGKLGDLTYLPIKGSDAIEYGFKINKSERVRARIKKLFGYDYPIERLTYQDKKSFRTKARRWMRDYKVRLNTFNDIKFSNI